MAEIVPSQRRPVRWGRRLRWLFLVLVLGVIAAHGIWGWVARRRLDAAVASLRARGEWTTVADLAMPPVADDDNAVHDLSRAASLVKSKSPAWQMNDRWEGDLPWPYENMLLRLWRSAIVRENQPALDAAAAAWHKQGVDWQLIAPGSTRPLLVFNMPMLSVHRQLAKLLKIAAITAHDRGDDAEALDRLGQMLRASRAMDEMRMTIITHLVAVGIEALAIETLETMTPELRIEGARPAGGGGKAATRVQVLALLRELSDELPLREGLQRGLRGERVLQLDTTAAILSGRMNAWNLLPSSLGGGGGTAPPRMAQELVLYAMRPLILEDTRRAALGTDPSIGFAADLPSARRQYGDPHEEVKRHPLIHFWAATFMPSLDKAIRVQFRTLTLRRLATVALAIRAYAADHAGELPARLDDLVPAYLPSVPTDPMTEGGVPLRYLPRSIDPVLYSVGTNGINDGGSEKPISQRRFPDRWDLEDVVIHVNR